MNKVAAADLDDIVKFSTGVKSVRDGAFGKRVSALVEKSVSVKGLTNSVWSLTAFVLDSEKTIAVSVLRTYNRMSGNIVSANVMHQIFAGPRTFIYQIMKDFPGDDISGWDINQDLSPFIGIEGIYEDRLADIQFPSQEEVDRELLDQGEIRKLTFLAERLNS